MREVIIWPLRVWLFAFSLGLSIVISIGVILSDLLLLFTLGLTLILILLLGFRSRLVIEANREQLIVGRARIESKYIESITVLDEEEMKYLRGPGINPQAYLAIRFWIKGGVKVNLNDSRDPTPYWLVSSRNPEALRTALAKN